MKTIQRAVFIDLFNRSFFSRYFDDDRFHVIFLIPNDENDDLIVKGANKWSTNN